MIVTDKKIYLEDKYIEKLDLMIKRISGKGTDDVLLPIDGNEGEGKTELAMATCYYIAYKTNREYTMKNVFFDLKECIEFIKNTENQVVHFDEAVLGLLINQRWEKTQIQFTQLVMVARKKRHFIVLCIPKFHRLPTYVIEDRAMGLVHVYARKNMEKGRFVYFKRADKDKLCEYWKKKREKGYKKFYTFRGTFNIASKKIFTPEELKEYERKKDEGIVSIGKEKEKENSKEKIWLDQRNKLVYLLNKELKLTSTQLSDLLRKSEVELLPRRVREIVQLVELNSTKPVLEAAR